MSDATESNDETRLEMNALADATVDAVNAVVGVLKQHGQVPSAMLAVCGAMVQYLMVYNDKLSRAALLAEIEHYSNCLHLICTDDLQN